MAIQMRRGLKTDFDATKMLPGEWAVSLDDDTYKQIVWMCFSAGITKRMATYEDMAVDIKDATAEIETEYKAEFEQINYQTRQYEVSASKFATNAETSANNAAASETAAKASETSASASETAAKASATSAAASADTATTAATNAATSASNASASSSTAGSYASQAQSTLDNVVTTINEAVNVNVPTFSVDFSTGHLTYTGEKFIFAVNNTTGDLEWEVA